MKKFFDVLEVTNRALIQVEKAIIVVLLFTMVFISFGQVVARNIFSVGFMWVDQLMRIEVIWIAFLGAALASEFGRHICVDILSHTLSGHRQKFIGVSANIIVFVICIFFFIAAANYIQLQRESSVSLLLSGIPDWTTRLVIPYFFIITAFRAILHSNKIIRQ